jgi:hypothetical protein
VTIPVDDDSTEDASDATAEAAGAQATDPDPFAKDDPVARALGGDPEPSADDDAEVEAAQDEAPEADTSEEEADAESEVSSADASAEPEEEPESDDHLIVETPEDPVAIGAEETGMFDAGQLVPPPDEEFDALGFDTSFGAMPSGFGAGPGSEFGDGDDTPPGGIYVGEAEDQVVLDAHAIGRALAEARGEETNFELPDMAELQRGLIGIDVGAAKAVVACFDSDGHHEIVPNQEDDLSTPAQVFFDEDGEQLVGREARQMAPSAPKRAVANLKEMLSDPDFQYEDEAHESLDAEDVLAIFLKRLVGDATEHFTEKPTHVALAAPAWFGEEQLDRLKGAVVETGLMLVGITEEALAAAVLYSLRLNDLKPRRALVFDCGHAALGVAVVLCQSGDITVLARASRRDLGSSAWDRLIADEAARVFKRKFGHDPYDDPAAALDLKHRAEDAKRSLSQRPQCTVSVSSQGKTLKVGFTRTGLEKAAGRIVKKSRELVHQVRQDAGLESWSEIDSLILMGGGSRTPALRKMISEATKLKPERGINPEEGVAVGALYWGIGERHRLNR